MEVTEQPTTLARKLGDIAHVSPLWWKVRQTCGCSGDRALEWLLKCAIERGASHYRREFASDLPPDSETMSNEELAVALCLGQHPYNSVFIRAAAQLLSSSDTNATQLVRLARMERVEAVLLHIAAVANRFDSGAQPWASLLEQLPRRSSHNDSLPHWSRFVSQTGITPMERSPSVQWLRRGKPAK